MLDGVKRAVFFGAHTDDEMVCAGTLHRLVRQGCEVHVVTFGPAAIQSERTGELDSRWVTTAEWNLSLDTIGVKPRDRQPLGWIPSAKLHEMGQGVADYSFQYIEKHRPDLALILSPDDENPAHAEVGRQCERVMRGRVPLVLRCNFPWNYSYGRGNVYVNLTDEDLDVKRRVIEAYKSQAFRYDYSMFLDLARADGKSVKCEAAERFELVRGVV